MTTSCAFFQNVQGDLLLDVVTSGVYSRVILSQKFHIKRSDSHRLWIYHHLTCMFKKYKTRKQLFTYSLKNWIYNKCSKSPPHFSRAVKTYFDHRFPGWLWPTALATQISRPYPLHLYLRKHIKNLVHQQRVETRNALFRFILDAASCVKVNPNEIMWATRSIHRRAMMCTEAESGHFEHFL
jgi:hypothetical protein